MNQITPAIISSNFEEIKAKIASLEGLVPWVHLDIMDGEFVSEETWQVPEDLENIGGSIKIETHLMINHPEEVLPTWTSKVDRVLIHFEATDYLADIIESLTSAPCHLGLALEMQTPITEIEKYLGQLDFIQLMSIDEIGRHGYQFNPEVLNRVKTLRDLWPEGIIQLDGGINLENATEALGAGVDNLVIGSALWQATDLNKKLKEFQTLNN